MLYSTSSRARTKSDGYVTGERCWERNKVFYSASSQTKTEDDGGVTRERWRVCYSLLVHRPKLGVMITWLDSNKENPALWCHQDADGHLAHQYQVVHFFL